MILKNTENSYGLIARFFHWLIAIGIITLITVGFIMTSLPSSPEKFEIYGIHKAFGVTMLMLIIFRILWKWSNKAVQPPSDLPYFIKIAAKAGHFLLYILILLMPISGIMASRFAGYDISVFNLFTISALEKDAELSNIFNTIHGLTAWFLIVLIILHIGAAFYHHFIRKDNVLKRIITG